MKKIIFSTVLLLITIVSGLNIYFSYQIKFVIDALTEQNEQLFYSQIVYLSIIIVVMLICEYFRQVIDTRYLNEIGFSIHKTLIGHLLTNKIDEKNLVSRINNDIEMVKEQYYDTLFSLYQGIVYFIFATIALFKLDSITALWVLCLSLFPILIPNVFKKYLRKIQNNISSQKANYNDKLEDFLDGLLVIKNSKQVKVFYNQLINEYDKINKLVNFRNVLTSLVNVLTGFIFYATIIAILYIGGREAIHGNASVGDIVSIFTISAELVMPVNLITSSIANIQSVGDLKKELVTDEKIKFSDAPDVFEFKSIEFKNTNYEVNGVKIINNFSANFERGKKYLIQGESGSGKSTLALLMTQNKHSQNIFMNDKKLSEYEYNDVQKIIAYLPQDSFLFKGTFLENITFYDEIHEEEIISLLKLTKLYDKFKTISELKEKRYDKKIMNISGGQKQRIAVIRALLQDKQVIILDETLSGLDKDTYLQVEQLLLGLKDKTFIHISHRTYPETVSLYDAIYTTKNTIK